MLEGTKLGHYEIREKIGSGGMGEVYLAHDEKLDRFVALKVLLPEFYSNQERVQRFNLEAKAASTLNHPNIITIHEIGESDDRIYIATEYVKGETLRQKIEKGELNLLSTLEIAEQLADALTVAHASHIVHRDIKPENVMIRDDGYVKILDFGLAKPTLHSQTGTEDKTLQLIQTQPGLVMGSVRYMSPEQARGKDVDGRTDVWSLGVVLYEMLTSTNPFDGETASDSIAALIHVNPPPIENIPDDLQEIIKKALRKDVSERYPSVKDFALDLRDVREQIEQDSGKRKAYLTTNPAKTTGVKQYDTSESKTLIHSTVTANNAAAEKGKTQVTGAAPARSRWRFLPVFVLALAGLIAFGALLYNGISSTKELPSFEAFQMTRLTENGRADLPAISPDGKYMAFVSEENGLRSLVVRQTENGGAVQIAPPTNLMFFRATFSPDSNYVYYVLVDRGVGTLYQVSTLGGERKKIVSDIDSRVTFSSDGKRLAFIRRSIEKANDTIYTANIDGSNEQPLITTGEAKVREFSDLDWTPKEDKILIGAVDKVIGNNWVEIKPLVVSIADKHIEPFGDKNWINADSFAWNDDGTGVYFIGKKKAEDTRQVWLISYPFAEAKQITNDSDGYDSMSLARNTNLMVTSKKNIITSIWKYAPQNKELNQLTAESRLQQGTNGIIELSNKRILFTKADSRQINLWLMNDDGTEQKQLTADTGLNLHPVVTPDEKYIVYASNRSGTFSIWRMNIDGTNPVKLTNPADALDLRPQLTDGGKKVIFERRFESRSANKLLAVSIDGNNEAPLFPESQTGDSLPRISNDGKWMAYTAQNFDAANLIFKSYLNIVDLTAATLAPKSKETRENIGLNYQWTKDDKNLTYMGTQGIQNLFNYSLETNASKQLTNFNSGVIMHFGWSNDGKTLYIVRGIVNSDLILIKDEAKA